METRSVSELLVLTASKDINTDFDSFLEQVLKMLASELDLPYSGFWICNESERKYTCIKTAPFNLYTGIDIVANQFRDLNKTFSHAEIIVQHTTDDGNWNIAGLENFLPPLVKSWMCLPLVISGNQFGFVCVGAEKTHVWDQEDQNTMLMAGMLLKQSYFENYYVDKATVPLHVAPKNESEGFERISNQISDYVFYTAHNLRHPITNILALIEMIKELEKDADSQDEILDLLKIETMKLDEVVRVMVAKLNMNEHEI